MTPKQRDWYYRTRRPDFLWKLGLGIVLAGFALAVVAEGVARWTGWRHTEANLNERLRALLVTEGDDIAVTAPMSGDFWADYSKLAETNFEAALQYLPILQDRLPRRLRDQFTGIEGPDISSAEEMSAEVRALREAEQMVLRNQLTRVLPNEGESPTRQEIGLLLWDGLTELPVPGSVSPSLPQPRTRELRALALEQPPARYVNVALALLESHANNPRAQLEALEREGRTFPEARNARAAALRLAFQDVPDALPRLVEDPAFADVVNLEHRLQGAVRAGEWGRVFMLVPATAYVYQDYASLGLALFAGLVWFLILVRGGPQPAIFSRRTGLALVAVGLGVLSIWPTLWAVYWQEYGWGLVEDRTDLFQNLKFYILGVGLREELCKLLLFLPLAIFLAREGNGLEILILAGCVGLGFAMEENVGYFSRDLSAATVGRFLTANFMHVALTGLLGLSLCRFLRNPGQYLGDFLGTFTVMVFAHGLYNTFISTEALGEYAIVTMIIFILLAYRYFDQMEALREPQRDLMVSFSAIFIGGLALIFSITLVTLTFQYGLGLATSSMYFGALGVALLIIVFMRQFKEVRGI